MHFRSFDYDDVKKIEWRFTTSTKSKVSTLQNIITFDIETSNGYRLPDGKIIGIDIHKYIKDEKYAEIIDNAEEESLLYIWQCSVESFDGHIYTFFGRKWDDYYDFLLSLSSEIRRAEVFGGTGLNANPNDYIVSAAVKRNVKTFTYIHNLGFEFQHLLNLFDNDFTKRYRSQKTSPVFARTSRSPMKAYINFNKVKIEYRDTLCLVGKKLDTWCKDENLPVKKLTTLPDRYYDAIRTPETPLSALEMDYSEQDVVSMVYGVQKYRDKYETLENIPLTKTGEVRRDVRKAVCDVDKAWSELCVNIMQNYTFKEYDNLLKLFVGGWTHASALYSGIKFESSIYGMNIRCFDLSSSYPASLTMFKYPVSNFDKVDSKDFQKYSSMDVLTSDYRWYAEIKLKNMNSKIINTFWSLSKTVDISGYEVDNGKVSHADSVTIMLTDVDWWIFQQAYEWDSIEVLELHVATAGYLSKELILKILDYFRGKQMLKGVKGSESKYASSKAGANSIYGVSAQKLCTDSISFDLDPDDNTAKWDSHDVGEMDFYEEIKSLKPEKIFLAYQHAPWVTAWSRFRLFRAILKFDEVIFYCDTDSCKGMFDDSALKWFADENAWVAEMQTQVATTLGFDPELYNPKNPLKPNKDLRLGIWDREDDCIEFCTYGAKRYVYRTEDDKMHVTIAGLPKKAGTGKIHSLKDFYVGMVWNAEESGKLIACYNDNQTPGIWIDRDGNTYNPSVKESAYPKYGLCLKPTSFKLTQSDDYQDFLSVFQYGTRSMMTMDLVDDLPEMNW